MWKQNNLNLLKVKKISRRDFLKLAGIGGAAVALKPLLDKTAGIWQPEVVDLGIEALKNPATIETVLAGSANSLELLALRDHRATGAPEITANPFYKPMAQIIGEVLDQRRKEGKPISYQKVTGYEDLPYYLDKVQAAAHDPSNRDRSLIESGEVPASSYVLGYKPNALEEATIYSEGFFPNGVKSVWFMSNNTFDSSPWIVRRGSGFFDQMIESLGEESRILFYDRDWSDLEKSDQANKYYMANSDGIDQVARTCLLNVKQHIEKLVTQTGTPVSSGEVFSYRLGLNNGSIDKSLMDTTLFLKYMARNDTTLKYFFEVKEDPELARANEDWYKANIKDEYGKIGCYQKLPHETYPYNGLLAANPEAADLEIDKDLHLLNQIGKPYHAWNLVVMLTAVPPTMAQTGVAWRQLETFDEQGPTKTAADFRVALEFGGLDSLFRIYS